MTHANQRKKHTELVGNLALFNGMFKWYSQLAGNDGACIEQALKARPVCTKNANPVDVYLGRVTPDKMVERGTLLLAQKEAMIKNVKIKYSLDATNARTI